MADGHTWHQPLSVSGQTGLQLGRRSPCGTRGRSKPAGGMRLDIWLVLTLYNFAAITNFEFVKIGLQIYAT